MAGAFVASPELRAYAAATITSADIVNETIKSEDIKNSEVKAADIGSSAVGSSEIAANSVGASELIGVTKLQFRECTQTSASSLSSGSSWIFNCSSTGTESGDSVVATVSDSSTICFAITRAEATTNNVDMYIMNVCNSSVAPGTMTFSIIVYDT